jgi:hypothetical protein
MKDVMTDEGFFSRSPRRVVVLAWWVGVPIAVGLLTLGLIGDDKGFWENKPYLTNILTACTGAAVGIPFAISFLNWFSRTQAAASDRLFVLANAKRSVSSLELSLSALTKGDEGLVRLRELAQRGEALQGRLEKLEKEWWSAGEYITRHEGAGVYLDYAKIRAVFGYVIEELIGEVAAVSELARSSLLNQDDLETIEFQFRSDWQAFDTVVRLRVNEKKSDWLPLSVYKALSRQSYRFISAEAALDGLAVIEKVLGSKESELYWGIFHHLRNDQPSPGGVAKDVQELLMLWNSVADLRECVDNLK